MIFTNEHDCLRNMGDVPARESANHNLLSQYPIQSQDWVRFSIKLNNNELQQYKGERVRIGRESKIKINTT